MAGQAQRDQVFISYAREDESHARRLYEDLKKSGMSPWLDQESLLPGQSWEDEIESAINNSRVFIVLLSSNSISKDGFIKREIDNALRLASQLPKSRIFVIPLSLDKTGAAHKKLKHLHTIDMSDSWAEGLRRVLRAIHDSPASGIRQHITGVSKKTLFWGFLGALAVTGPTYLYVYLSALSTTHNRDSGFIVFLTLITLAATGMIALFAGALASIIVMRTDGRRLEAKAFLLGMAGATAVSACLLSG